MASSAPTPQATHTFQAWCLCQQCCLSPRALLQPSLVSKYDKVYPVTCQLHPLGPSLLPYIPRPTRQCFNSEEELTLQNLDKQTHSVQTLWLALMWPPRCDSFLWSRSLRNHTACQALEGQACSRATEQRCQPPTPFLQIPSHRGKSCCTSISKPREARQWGKDLGASPLGSDMPSGTSEYPILHAQMRGEGIFSCCLPIWRHQLISATKRAWRLYTE